MRKEWVYKTWSKVRSIGYRKVGKHHHLLDFEIARFILKCSLCLVFRA